MALLAALVVGLVVGGVVVAVFSGGDHITVTRTAQSPTTTPPTTGSDGAPDGSANVQLTKACLRSVNDAQRAYAALGAIGSAARDLDFSKLDEIVRRVQALQRDLAADLQACRADIRLPPGSGVGASPSGGGTGG